jgi:hypothetical protein
MNTDPVMLLIYVSKSAVLTVHTCFVFYLLCSNWWVENKSKVGHGFLCLSPSKNEILGQCIQSLSVFVIIGSRLASAR